MDMKRVVVLGGFVLASILAGAGFEHVRLQALQDVEEEPDPAPLMAQPMKEVRHESISPDAALLAEANALRKRVAELEKALAERETAIAQVPETPKEEQAPRDRSRRQSFAERMEQMKKENPEQYAEMQKRREEFRQNMEQRAVERASFLDAVDTQGMTAEQRENHDELLATVARVNELMAQIMQSDGNRDATHDLRHEMGETMGALGALYENERQYLLESTARAAGYSGDDISAFASHVQTIIQNTTMSPGFGGRGPGPGHP